MPQLILVRHGQTDWIKQDRIQGSLDIPLNHDGEKEASKISRELSVFKIDGVYSSPALCSVSTACEIVKPHSLKVKKIDGLKELDHGVWQGLLVSDVKKRYKKQYQRWKASLVSSKPPKGESFREAYDRAIGMTQKIMNKHKDENICVVSHNLVLSMIKCHLSKVDLENIWKFVSDKTWWEKFELQDGKIKAG